MTTEVQTSGEHHRKCEPDRSQRRLRVGYLTAANPSSRWDWSGIHYFMFNSLSARGLNVSHLGHSLMKQTTRLDRVLQGFGIRSNSKQPLQVDLLEQSRHWGSELRRELARSIVDVIFAPVASQEIAFLETNVPIVYLSDATFRLIGDDYAWYSNIPESQARAEE